VHYRPSALFVDRTTVADYTKAVSKTVASPWEELAVQPDNCVLGRGEAEEARLKRQIADLAPDSDALFEKIGIKPGERVVDLGCGPGGVLHLLGAHVGPTGSVLGVERSPHFVDLARRFIANHRLPQVEVREGDAYDTGLARASFDGCHMRLVLVNVPKPERIVRELVSLVCPGGWVASSRRTLCPTSAIRRCPNGLI
jgi:tRNA A58 N-methylase Trm61